MSERDEPRLRPEGRPEMGALLWRYGYQVRARDEEFRRQSGWRPENLRKPGFEPATIVDVGVGFGTPSLYDAFPDAYLVLVEPLVEFEQRLRRIVARRAAGGECVLAAAGSSAGTAVIHVDAERPVASSIPPKTGLGERELALLEKREVPLVTLDGLLADRGWRGPFGVKIDVEGFEDEVVRGAPRLLEQAQFVIAEVSVRSRFEGSYEFADFIALMRERGFALSDVLDGQKTGLGGEVLFLDALFRRPTH